MPDFSMDEVGQRVREERLRLGATQDDWASATGVHRNSQRAYEQGRTTPTIEYVLKLGQLGADVGYLMTGHRSKDGVFGGGIREELRQLAKRSAEASKPADAVQVAEIDLTYGMGATYLEEHPELEPRTFSRAWLRNFTESPPEELFWARGQGNSMEPTISEGAIVLIDRRQNNPRMADLIWAFAFGEIGMIKRLRPMPDGSVKILSDNQAVPLETAHDDELHIIGRVVAVVKKL